MAEDFPVTDITKTFLPTSRYKNTNIYAGSDGQYYYGIWKAPTIDAQPPDIYHTIEVGENLRLDALAYKYYGNYQLWWVLATANDILDPFTELTVGDTIRIPYLPYIFSDILA